MDSLRGLAGGRQGARPGGPGRGEAGRARTSEAELADRFVGTELTLGLDRAGEARMSSRRAGMALLLGGGGRGGEARPEARRPGPGATQPD